MFAALKAKVNVVATLSLTENAIGPKAQKPLTIWPTVRGTCEITNTDCEGRLALVDAFTYVQRTYRVHTILDCATLTLGVWMICGDTMVRRPRAVHPCPLPTLVTALTSSPLLSARRSVSARSSLTMTACGRDCRRRVRG